MHACPLYDMHAGIKFTSFSQANSQHCALMLSMPGKSAQGFLAVSINLYLMFAIRYFVLYCAVALKGSLWI